MIEKWRHVLGTDGSLRVSDLGRAQRVRKLSKMGHPGRIGVMFTPPPSGRVWVQGRGSKDIAVLILEAFVGPKPNGMECCHFDDDRTNNKLSNLRWGTPKSNSEDRVRNGRARGGTEGGVLYGEQNGSAKLTKELVVSARKLHTESPQHYSCTALAKQMNVTPQTMHRALTGKTWGHVV